MESNKHLTMLLLPSCYIQTACDMCSLSKLFHYNAKVDRPFFNGQMINEQFGSKIYRITEFSSQQRATVSVMNPAKHPVSLNIVFN